VIFEDPEGRAAAERFSARSPRVTRVTFTVGGNFQKLHRYKFSENCNDKNFEQIAPIFFWPDMGAGGNGTSP